MLQRLQASIDSGDVQIIYMHAEGGGEQVLELFRRLVEKVLKKRELEKIRLDAARAVWPKRFGKEMPDVMTAAECDRSALRIGSEILYPDARLLRSIDSWRVAAK
jgi:hypothetical protein